MPKIVDREEMKNGILDAAMRIFAEKGYHAATIADVAAEAGLGKGTLYLYFRNKEAIAEAMVDRHFDAIEERMTARERPNTIARFLDNLSEGMAMTEGHAVSSVCSSRFSDPASHLKPSPQGLQVFLNEWARAMRTRFNTCRPAERFATALIRRSRAEP